MADRPYFHPPYLSPVKMTPTQTVRDKDPDSRRGEYHIDPKEFDAEIHERVEARPRKAKARAAVATSTASAAELAMMTQADLKKLPEFASIPKDIDLTSKQALVDAILKVRAGAESDED